jgi:hypothetical protein
LAASCEFGDTKVDRALQAAHEGLGAGRELLKAVDEGGKGEMEFGVVGRLVRNEGRQCIQQFEDIVERRRLQFAGAVQVLVEDGEGLLGSLARGTELVEAPLAVKFLD